jgi:hypothetical protein
VILYGQGEVNNLIVTSWNLQSFGVQDFSSIHPLFSCGHLPPTPALTWKIVMFYGYNSNLASPANVIPVIGSMEIAHGDAGIPLPSQFEVFDLIPETEMPMPPQILNSRAMVLYFLEVQSFPEGAYPPDLTQFDYPKPACGFYNLP